MKHDRKKNKNLVSKSKMSELKHFHCYKMLTKITFSLLQIPNKRSKYSMNMLMFNSDDTETI